MSLSAGLRLGPYEIVAPLGAGGMGEVYRARDPRLGRDVAIKVLPSSVATDPDRRARFEREARSVAALSHPNILAIFDFSVYDGHACAVTELLEGRTLRDALADGPLPVRRAIDIAVQIARGLSAAHDKGIVHRDLKPENVFLTGDGQVKILDFGVAKAIADAQSSETMAGTDPGTVMGTVGYMAPEQVRGQPVEARADLFALGTVLYEMLSGRRAFQRETAAETMTAILKEDPPELSAVRADLPPVLDTIVRHCLERNPGERFQSARDLIFSLQAATATGSGPAAAAPAARTVRPAIWRERGAWTLAAVLALVLVATAIPWRSAAPAAPLPVTRFQIAAPDGTVWGSPLGAPEGSNGGSISPDGTMLAFTAADASGKTLLWVRALDSFTARSFAGTDGAAFPFWSPDGHSLGFFTITKLKKIAVEGGPAQTLCDIPSTPRGATWSGKGVIVFGTSGGPLRQVSTEGGRPAALTAKDDQGGRPAWPVFLPDDNHFLFYSAIARAVFAGSLDSPATKRITQSDSNPVFAPPGRILFIREGALFAQSFDVARLEVSGDARPVAERVGVSDAPWNIGAFSLSRTGLLTYRQRSESLSQFAWFDRSGKQLATVGPPGNYLAPALSPDESRLAYSRRDDQPAGDIWTLEFARPTPTRFTFSPETDIYPLWTPDGSAIIYSSTTDGVVVKPFAAAGAARKLVQWQRNNMAIPMQVSGGNTLVLFGDMGTETGFDVFTAPFPAGGTPVPVVQGPLTDAEAQISPDGRWLAYATTETGGYEVFVQPVGATGARWQVSTAGGRQPQWRRDGRELFFVTNDRKFYAVEVRAGASFEVGTPRLLFDMPSNTVAVRNSYVPSRDGQRFLVNKLLNTTPSPINVIVNWPGAR
jgi:Tol biopolymer transport system component